MVFKHSCTIFSAVSAAPPMGSYCGHVYTETFLAKNGYFPLRMHLSFTQKQQKTTKTKMKRLSKVETLKMFLSLPFLFPRVNRENATKMHTCFSKYTFC